MGIKKKVVRNGVLRELAGQAQRGVREAMEELLIRARPLVVSICKRQLRDWQDAEDAAQETLFRAFTRFDQLRRAEAFPGWISLIARNTALNYRRNNMKSAQFARYPINENDAEAPADYNPPHTLQVEERREETRGIVSSALSQLGTTRAELLRDRYLAGKSHKELAARHLVTVECVKWHLWAGRKELRKLLSDREL